MSYQRKILIARGLHGPYSDAFDQIVTEIPSSVLATIPARALADLVSAIHRLQQREFQRGQDTIAALLNLPEGR